MRFGTSYLFSFPLNPSNRRLVSLRSIRYIMNDDASSEIENVIYN